MIETEWPSCRETASKYMNEDTELIV
ncbi:hypothetical protein B14911_07543 [Bacillus sp. NRRL B-14911]|nr:hypothetical protein B14911_07543 [Bacillus sp. NRRL B-14911]